MSRWWLLLCFCCSCHMDDDEPPPLVDAPDSDDEAVVEHIEPHGAWVWEYSFRVPPRGDIWPTQRGFSFPVKMKGVLIHVWRSIASLWRNKRTRLIPRNQTYTQFIRQEFQRMTGFSYRRAQEFEALARSSDSYLHPPEQRGPKPMILYHVYDDFEHWLEKTLSSPDLPGRSVPVLVEKYALDYSTRPNVSEKKMGEMLHSLGYQWMPRRKAYVLRKHATVNVARFKTHCQLIETRVEFDPVESLWRFKDECPTYFWDEAYMLSGDMLEWTWGKRGAPLTKLMDLSRGGYRRVALIGGISSASSSSTGEIIEEKSYKAYWNQAWKPKRGRKFFGKCNADSVKKFCNDILLPSVLELPEDKRSEVIVFLDNWSAHCRLREDARGLSDDQLAEWVQTELAEAENAEGLREFGLLDAHKGSNWAGHRKELYRFINEWKLKTRELDELCSEYGVLLTYLAPFRSESNPQEYIWARVKYLFKSDTSDDPWETKLERAFSQITPLFIRQCISRSIVYCLDELKKMEEADRPAPFIDHDPPDDQNSDSFASSDDYDEEDFNLE